MVHPTRRRDPSSMLEHANSSEWRALLECASPRVDSGLLRQALLPSLDWGRWLALADEHGVLALAARRARECDDLAIPPDVLRNLTERYRAQAFFTLGMTAELFRLLNHLASRAIGALVIKGPVLSMRCYGDPGLRPYGDLDLIVRERDVRLVTELMIGLGYQPRIPLAAIDAGRAPGEYVFRHAQSGILVEFHTESTFRYHPRPVSVEKLFARRASVRFDGHEAAALSPEDELVLISIHAAKHCWTRLLWIADVAAFASHVENLDWKRAFSIACEVGAERMLRVGLHLAAALLKLDLPREVAFRVSSDASVHRIVKQIQRRLPEGKGEELGLAARAAYRMSMHGGGFAPSAMYLMRLSLSPTEDDWAAGPAGKRAWLSSALRRPLRLAKKYARGRAAISELPPNS